MNQISSQPRRPSENVPTPEQFFTVTGATVNVNPTASVPNAASGVLSREFVARRISEGETGRLKEELKCQACGKGYKHVSSLAKHLWEHTPEWTVTSKLLISKHQQVQLLEAASILVAMNEEDEQEDATTNTTTNTNSAENTTNNTNKNTTNELLDSSPSPTPLTNANTNIPHINSIADTRPIHKIQRPRRGSITSSPRRSSISSSMHHFRSGTPGSFTHRNTLLTKSPIITDSLLSQDCLSSAPLGSSLKQDDYELLASPYQRSRRMSHLRHSSAINLNDHDHDHENDEDEALDSTPHDSPEDSVFGEME